MQRSRLIYGKTVSFATSMMHAKRQTRRFWICFVIGSALYLQAPDSRSVLAQTQFPDEYTARAHYLFNLTRFIKWPADALGGPKDPIVFGIFGENAFGFFYSRYVLGKKIDGRSLVVKQIGSPEKTEGMHVVYIGPNERPRMQQVLDSLKGRSVLTVSEIEGFAASGGMIQIFSMSDRGRFEIHVSRADEAHLRIDSSLLGMAKIYREDPPPNRD